MKRLFGVCVVALLLGAVNQTQAQITVFSDNFNQFANGVNLLGTNYTPAIGNHVDFNSRTGSPTVVAQSFSGNIAASFTLGASPSAASYYLAYNPLGYQAFTLAWNQEIASSMVSTGGFMINLQSAEGANSFSPIVALMDNGAIGTFTNSPSLDTFIPIGNWTTYAAPGTFMTNSLTVNYGGNWSFRINGALVYTAAMSSFFTNILGAIEFDAWHEMDTPDNSYAIDNVTVTVPEPSALLLTLAGCSVLLFRRRTASRNK